MHLELQGLVFGRPEGVRLEVRWSFFLTLPLASAFAPSWTIWASYALLIAVHLLGHAVFVQREGAAVGVVVAQGWGGVCRPAEPVRVTQGARIAWGGVLAQLVALVAAVGLGALGWLPDTVTGFEAQTVLVHHNALLMALNLLPIVPFDGARAWRVFGWLHRLEERHRAMRQRRVVEHRRRAETLWVDGLPRLDGSWDETVDERRLASLTHRELARLESVEPTATQLKEAEEILLELGRRQ